MRQSGIVAAAALYALDNHVERLAEDHEKAQILAEGLAQQGYEVSPPQTNMVYFKHTQAQTILDQAREQGVMALTAKAQTIRLVTHSMSALKILKKVFQSLKASESVLKIDTEPSTP